MNGIATTIEQSKKLIDLGLDTKTADLYWWTYENKTYLSSMDDKEYQVRTDTPAWSLSALLALAPTDTSVLRKGDNCYVCDCVDYGTPYFETAVDAAYDLVKHLLEKQKK